MYLGFLIFAFLPGAISKYLATTTLQNNVQNILLSKYGVIIGATNKIYRLNEKDLTSITSVSTGPARDNPQCIPTSTDDEYLDFTCDSVDGQTLSDTDNLNQVLVLMNDSSSTEELLLACGNVLYGQCKSYSIVDLAKRAAFQKIASYRPGLNTVASLGEIHGAKKVLFVAREVSKVYSAFQGQHSALIDVWVVSGKLSSDSTDRVLSATYNDQLGFNADGSAAYNIHYVSIFAVEKFVYFTTVQKYDLQSSVSVSRLVRQCLLLKPRSSYVESTLVCRTNSKNYNVIMATKLIKVRTEIAELLNVTEGSDVVLGLFRQESEASNFALCSFGLSNVNLAITTALNRCANKGLGEGVPWIKATTKICQTGGTGDVDCGQRDLPYLNNEMVISGSVIDTFSSPLYAGMEAIVHPRGLAIFLSASSYQMKKYAVLKSGLYQYGVSEFPAKMVSDTGGFSRIVYDVSGSFLYAAGGKMVVRDSIMDCEERRSCKDCLAGPFCGWCTLESRCSMSGECKTKTSDKQTFIEDSISSCPVASDVTPRQVSVQMKSKVTINTLNLPSKTALKCSFNGLLVESVTVGAIVTCGEVNFGSIPKLDLSGGSSSIPVSLVLDTRSGPAIVILSTSLIVYDCGAAEKSCLRCTRGQFPCSWCPQELRCADASSCSKSGSPEIPYQGPQLPFESSVCPRVTVIDTPYVSHGLYQAVKLSGSNLPVPSGGFTYQCETVIGKKSVKLDADYNETGITCSSSLYTYDDEHDTISNVTAFVSLYYGGTLIDSLPQTTVTVYKCRVSRSDCSLCLVAPAPYKCGWCETGTCTVQDQCSSSWITSCVDVTIRRFSPSSGAVFGGTHVTLEGSDLGTTVDDVLEVSIAGQPCTVLKELYVSSKRVVCQTQKVSTPVSGAIKIRVRSPSGKELQGLSKEPFSFEEPVVEGFKPIVGPCSGGTELTVFGQHLTVGENITIMADDTECKIMEDKKFSTNITCVTQPGCLNRLWSLQNDFRGVKVIFDGVPVVASSGVSIFQYLPDPNITSVTTRKGDSHMNIYFSGGQDVIVAGERLDLIQEPKLTLSLLKRTFNGPCSPGFPTGLQLVCMTPNISSAVGTLNRTVVMLGFKMDSVSSVRAVKNVTAVSDPHFERFDGEGGILEIKSSDLIIRGSGITLLTKGDISVTVAGLPCKIIALDEKLLACSLPSEDAIREVTSANPVVQVAVGRGGLVFTLGALKFYKPSTEAVPWLLYIGPPVAGSVVLVIIIIILVVLYRRRSRKEKYAKVSYQRRMDKMESQYARTAKEVFAEYQTEMVDLTQDVDQSQTPYLTFEQFAMRVLYPGLDYHPIMEKESSKSDAWKKCMKSLISLLKERDFLVTFVRTLEAQGSFQMTDRCIVASLLMVSLQDDIHYVTEILKDLLVDLINKTGGGKRSKLLLRRTESVAEKLLTNWLAYTLHGFLEDNVGQPLFKLFVAINALLDKEPVDAVTCDARNSLSEDKLLRQKVDFTNLTVTAEYENKTFPGIALLSCDTISQAKEKILKHIFKNVPYSSRPSADHMDLGCVSPNGAVLVLQDADTTNIVEGEWKRTNTLDHYKIPNGCTLRLCVDEADYNGHVYGSNVVELNPNLTSPSLMSSIKRKASDGKRRSKSRSLADMNSEGKGSITDCTQPSIAFQPNTSSTPMLNNHNRDLSFRVWHLVKANDFPQEPKEDVRQSKMMAEVYLTRLLKTKEALQPYVNSLFSAVFGLYKDGERIIPPSVKLLFDFLDKEAAAFDIDDQEVHHTWKNNSLPLRFWINMIKNPNFVFDVKKEPTVDSCLSVIAQLFMDSCSPDEHRLGKDSPSNKLLYAKEIPEYKKKVKKFYADVRQYRAVTEDLEKSLDEISQKYGGCFNSLNAASELMTYAVKYKVKVMDNLEEAKFGDFAERLQEIMETLPDE